MREAANGKREKNKRKDCKRQEGLSRIFYNRQVDTNIQISYQNLRYATKQQKARNHDKMANYVTE